MKIIIDEREHALFEKCESIMCSLTKPTFAILSKEVLNLGDVLIATDENKPVLLIERKSFSDLLASIKDGRYEEQSYRLLHSSRFPAHSVIYVLEGLFSQLKNPADKKIILSAMTSLHFFKGFSVFRTTTVQETAEWLISMADKIEREFGKGKYPYYLTAAPLENILVPSVAAADAETAADYCSVVKKEKKKNVTPENIGEIILCQIPGISSVTAISIMKKFSGFSHFMSELKANPDCLNDMLIGDESGKMRKISKTTVDNIRVYLLTDFTAAK
jgi:ERCC4-type nuclease